MSDILTGTPPDLTYGHEMVRLAWLTVWAVASGALMVILGWMGLSFIVQERLGRHQSGWREMVPRGWSWASPQPPHLCDGAPWSSTWPTPFPASSPRP